MGLVNTPLEGAWERKWRKVRVMVPEEDLQDIQTLIIAGRYRNVEQFVMSAVYKLLTRYGVESGKVQVETESSC